MDKELFSEQVQIERKVFSFELRENPRGRFLKVTEDVGGRRDTVIMPATGLGSVREILDRVTKQDVRIIWQMILGLFIITGLSIIPYYIGLIVRLICILLGLGGMLMTRKVRMARAQEA